MLLDRIDNILPSLSLYVERHRGVRLDSSNTIFLKRQLQAVEARVYRKKYPDLVWRQLLPIQSDQGRGPKTYSYQTSEHQGEAAFAEPGTDGLPTVSLKNDEVIGHYRSYGTKYIYSWDELDAANFAGYALNAELGMAARHAFEILSNTTVHLGHAGLKLQGLISDLSLLTEYTIVNDGTGSSKKWKDKTGAQIFRDLMALITQTGKTTANAFKANCIALPIEQAYIMMEKKMSEYDQRTVFEAFTKAYDELAKKMGLPELKIVIDPALAAAGPNNKSLILAYPYDEEVAAIKLPMDFTMFTMREDDDGNFKVPCWGRTGGVVLRHPKAIVYGVDI